MAAGRRANQETLGDAYSQDLFSLLRAGEHLDDILEVPFALAHIKDVHAAMQLAVAGAGEKREDLTGHSLFHPAFAAFVLGFSMGFATAHRSRFNDSRQPRLATRTQERCDEWGLAVALFYLVKVEAAGIIDRDTDRAVYGIENRWRLVSDERRLEPFAALRDIAAEARAVGEAWFHDESVEMGSRLAAILEQFVAAYPGRTFS